MAKLKIKKETKKEEITAGSAGGERSSRYDYP
jgi:hypothetical protein